MKINARIMRKNPFRNIFLCAAVICCIVLSIVFYYINHFNNKRTQAQYNQEKAELLMRDFENQLQSLKDISTKVASNYEFHPYYFEGDITREMRLLKSLTQYRYFSALSEEYFLYYGGNRIYRSTGQTLDLDLFVQSRARDQAEHEKFLTVLDEMSDESPSSIIRLKALSVFGDIYILSSFSVNDDQGQISAILGYRIKKSVLEERFQTISGGIRGKIALYEASELLYGNQEETFASEQEQALIVSSSDGVYTLFYLPEITMPGSLYFLQLLIVLADVILVFVISCFFAERAYKLIRKLSETYRGVITFDENAECENALEEVDYMLNSMLQKYAKVNEQIGQNQTMLRNHVLRLLINGTASMDVLSNLQGVQLRLPGPCFFVISISYEEEANITEEFWGNLQRELELICDEKEKEYLYTLCSFKEKLIQVICSIQTEERKEDLTEIVCNVAESFSYKPVIGVGNVYQTLSCLAASNLESMDDVQNYRKQQKNQNQYAFIYDSEKMQNIFVALETGNERKALELLESYAAKLSKERVSLLMLQYIFTDFLGALTKLSKKHMLNLSKQNMALFFTTKDVQGFKTAASHAIHDFCEKFESMKSKLKEDELYRVYQFINEHFAEYDMSIEKVADAMHISIAAVRQAVAKYTGKTYKEYLTYMRIEYAKRLLCQENITVAEVCQQVGYGNISYFITLFKNVTGVTPAKYKRDNEAG